MREKLGKSRRLRSSLDDVPGIGEVSRRKLLAKFGGIEAIREATDEALLSVSGVTRRQVAAIRAHLPQAGAPAVQDQDDSPQSDLATSQRNE
jgi:excinuclease ABC subunit C